MIYNHMRSISPELQAFQKFRTGNQCPVGCQPQLSNSLTILRIQAANQLRQISSQKRFSACEIKHRHAVRHGKQPVNLSH